MLGGRGHSKTSRGAWDTWTEQLRRNKSAFPVRRASLAGKTLPWPLVVTYLSRQALSGRTSEYLNIRYEIAQEPGSLYSGMFCWGGFWPSKGHKGSAFCWLCIVVLGEAFKYMSLLWYSKHAEIHSAFMKKQVCRVQCSSFPCYCCILLDEQQLYSAAEVATFLWFCACMFFGKLI